MDRINKLRLAVKIWSSSQNVKDLDWHNACELYLILCREKGGAGERAENNTFEKRETNSSKMMGSIWQMESHALEGCRMGDEGKGA